MDNDPQVRKAALSDFNFALLLWEGVVTTGSSGDQSEVMMPEQRTAVVEGVGFHFEAPLLSRTL